MQQEVEVNNSQRVQGQVMADIVIWKNEKKDKLENINSVIVLECKEEHITIQEEDYF
ncbi:hypothetical protein [Apibacter muscae]|uniref:hypothetical protein n=1 Tax=Apibacter muscae TaxID=2509004 RepID=UPI0021AAC320|nr:hypothetical protein [Apibacter muscae]